MTISRHKIKESVKSKLAEEKDNQVTPEMGDMYYNADSAVNEKNPLIKAA